MLQHKGHRTRDLAITKPLCLARTAIFLWRGHNGFGSLRHMSEIENPKSDTSDRGQYLYDALKQFLQSAGTNVGELWWNLVLEQFRWLSTSEARTDFGELVEAGCVPLMLATTIGLIRVSPRIEELSKVGTADKRKKIKIALERAATALEDGFGDLIANNEENVDHFGKIGYLVPSRLVSEMRKYAMLVDASQVLAKEFEWHSLTELTKYSLVGYVKRATGRFCDRSASGLIGEIVGSPDYDEVALRMWRSRNYERMDKNFSSFPDLLLVMGQDLTRLT